MAIAFGAASANKVAYPGNTTTITVSHTVGAGSDLFMLVAVGWYNTQGARTVSTVVWNGSESLSAVASSSVSSSDSHSVQLWKLAAPSTGTHNVVVTLSGNEDLIFCGVSSWSGVDQTSPLGTAATNTGTGATGQVTLSSAADQYVAGSIAHGAALASDFSTSDTEMWEQFDATTNLNSGAYSVGAGSVSLDWSGGNNVPWAATGVPILPVSAGGGTRLVKMAGEWGGYAGSSGGFAG